MVYPQAYHITFGVYLARPPGSAKPHVDRDHNEYQGPLAPTDSEREAGSRENAGDTEVSLNLEQRKVVEAAIREVAKRYGWIIHAIAIQNDHAHVVISAPRAGDQLREAIKAVASKWLNKQFGKRRWWAEGGSDRYLWESDYFDDAVKYVRDQVEI
jgi:REP element-mobilizing transposase RayT